MAEPTPSPALPSTADTTPYVPVAWAAVAAASVAGLFAFLLLVLGVGAFVNKKPLLTQELLVLPVVAIVLSFAARRMIRNAEGTRTGEKLANGAWWTSVVLGLGYIAYLFAIDFAVRHEAGTEAKQWVDQVREDKVDAAFYKALPPGARQGVRSTDTFELQRRYGAIELTAFRNTDLVKLARWNTGKDEFVFTPGGVVDWSYRPGSIDCVFTGTVTCPEGVFPVAIPLKGIEGVTGEGGGGGRQWAIAWKPGGGFFQQDKVERTSYGWLVLLMELEGAAFGKAFLDHVNFGPTGYPLLYRAFVADPGDPTWLQVAQSPVWFVDGKMIRAYHLFAAAPFGILHPNAHSTYQEHLTTSFFKSKDGAEPNEGQKGSFLTAWNRQGVFPAGQQLKGPNNEVPDKDTNLRITESAVEVLVPIEIPIQNPAGRPETARGKLVVACKDPALLAELKERKSAAKSEKPSNSPPTALRDRSFTWRVVRIESDLLPVSLQQTGQGGPPGMGGPGGQHGPGGHGG